MATLLSNILQNKTLTREGCLIDCREIHLEQNGGNRRSWCLAGTLNLDFNNGISARLVSFGENRPILSQFHRFVESTKIQSGQIFPDSHYFSLTAIDVDGQEWTNPRVEVNEAPFGNCTVITVRCDWLRVTHSAPGSRNFVRMLFLDHIDFPMNDMQRTEVRTAGRSSSKTEFIGSKGETTQASIEYIKAETVDAFNTLWAFPKEEVQASQNLSSKLIETIRFVTATKVSFCVSEAVHQEVATLEVGKVVSAKQGLFPQPLHSNHLKHVLDFYRLFDAYLKHALESSSDEAFSSLSMNFYPLYGLSEVSLDSIALLVSVTVEALVREQFPDIGKPEEQVLIDVTTINKSIDSLQIAERTKARAKGSIGGMKNSRADDKLNALKDSGILSNDEIAAWKGLRNASAHGSLHAAPNDMQKLLDKVFKAGTLLNKLALLSIGYAGKYTDHSTIGWPERDFPPTQELEACPLPSPPIEVHPGSAVTINVLQSDTPTTQDTVAPKIPTALSKVSEQAGTDMQADAAVQISTTTKSMHDTPGKQDQGLQQLPPQRDE